MKTERKCHGTGKAVGHGCGKMVPQIHNGQANRIYGIGKSCGCYPKWLMTTPEGLNKIKSSIGIGRKKVEKAESRKWTEEKKVLREKIISSDNYRAKYVQPLINEIARLIDHGQPCIATGNYEGKMAGGHYIAVGANRTICLHLDNIHIQSFHSNNWKGGDNLKYREGLINTYGIEYFEKVEALAQIPPIKLTKEDLIEIKSNATAIRNRLKKNPIKLPPMARIRMREKINQELGIYAN